ncbi:hypothetical protein BDP27DRAFT_1367362 [Rhodocollybia butyracea]|uniref:Uncharacterized protein n=1 Tax=Rhodocollybia butyracea TaxID=206335 RepID=A0A9P5PHY7_9AGAR|nr:hypothetical protein BDP27DRAFT_1367362 [Rhodocollybia butyracea]
MEDAARDEEIPLQWIHDVSDHFARLLVELEDAKEMIENRESTRLKPAIDPVIFHRTGKRGRPRKFIDPEFLKTAMNPLRRIKVAELAKKLKLQLVMGARLAKDSTLCVDLGWVKTSNAQKSEPGAVNKGQVGDRLLAHAFPPYQSHDKQLVIPSAVNQSKTYVNTAPENELISLINTTSPEELVEQKIGREYNTMHPPGPMLSRKRFDAWPSSDYSGQQSSHLPTTMVSSSDYNGLILSITMTWSRYLLDICSCINSNSPQ